MAAEDRVDGGPQRLRSIDDEQHLALRIDAARDDVFQQFGDHRGVLRGAFADAQHVLVALAVHAHRADHGVVAEDEPVDVDHQQLQLVETPRQQRLHLGLGGLDHPPAHRRTRNSHRLGHLRNDFLVVARGDAAHQDLQHPRPHLRRGFAWLRRRELRLPGSVGPLLRSRGRSTSNLRSLSITWPGWRP